MYRQILVYVATTEERQIQEGTGGKRPTEGVRRQKPVRKEVIYVDSNYL